MKLLLKVPIKEYVYMQFLLNCDCYLYYTEYLSKEVRLLLTNSS